MVIRTKSSKATAKAKAKEEALRGLDKVEKSLTATKASATKRVQKTALYKRAFDSSAELDAEDIVDLVYWLRQCQALILGFIYGAGNVTGQIGMTSFLALSIVGPTALVKRLHDFDEDEVSKVGTLTTEGMLPSFALFLLTWIISYTSFL